jgi:2-C-methyl-D-erythritol 2,4-cyclodiphosphate synthase
MRIGIGFDFHIIKKKIPMYLGGIKITDEFGFFSNTDGDILIHSIVDAILGAIGEKDIGEIFDDSWKGKSSTEILSFVKNIIEKSNYEILNIDAVIILEKPKISNYKEKIIENLSNLLDMDKNKINLKAKTMERIGFIGKGKGGASIATVLVNEKR